MAATLAGARRKYLQLLRVLPRKIGTRTVSGRNHVHDRFDARRRGRPSLRSFGAEAVVMPLDQGQFQLLDTTTIAGFSVATMQALSTTQIGWFLDTQFAVLADTQLGALAPTQIGYFTTSAIA